MKKIIVLAAIIIASTAFTIAQDKGTITLPGPTIGQNASTTWEGYLVDSKTAKEMAADPATQTQKASEYTRSSALALGGDNGFSLLCSGTWYTLDDAGNIKAQNVVSSSSKDKGLIVEVTGTLNGSTLSVMTLTEASADTVPQNN